MGRNLKKSAVLALLAAFIGIGSVGYVKAQDTLSYRDILAQNKNKDKSVINMTGRVTEVGSEMIKIKRGRKVYEVRTQGANIMDRDGKKINMNEIKTGDRVLIRGRVSGNTVTDVTRVRDINIPR
jgi:hypothetical protein